LKCAQKECQDIQVQVTQEELIPARQGQQVTPAAVHLLLPDKAIPASQVQQDIPVVEPLLQDKEVTSVVEPLPQDRVDIPVVEPLPQDRVDILVVEPLPQDREVTPVVEPLLQDKEVTPVVEPLPQDKEDTPAVEPLPQDKEDTPAVEPLLQDKEDTPAVEPLPQDKGVTLAVVLKAIPEPDHREDIIPGRRMEEVRPRVPDQEPRQDRAMEGEARLQDKLTRKSLSGLTRSTRTEVDRLIARSSRGPWSTGTGATSRRRLAG